jgi:hypothetical protein
VPIEARRPNATSSSIAPTTSVYSRIAACGRLPPTSLLGLDPRGRRLRAALAALLVGADAAELSFVHRWLNFWSGIGLVVAGMAHRGYQVSLGEHGTAQWIAVFYRPGGGHEHVVAAGRARAATAAGDAAGGVGGTAVRVKAEMRRLRCSIEPFKQLIENCLGTGGDRVQLRERGLDLDVAERSLPGQQVRTARVEAEASSRAPRAS